MNRPSITALSWFALLPLAALAGNDEHHHVQHGVHVHGEAALYLMLQGNELEMEFHSPAMNIVGFEHKAVSVEEKQKIQNALAILKQTDELFAFKGTQCKLEKAEAEFKLEENDEHDAEEHHDHEAEGNHAEHSEFHVIYQFTCDDGKSLRVIEVNLPARFSGIRTLDAEWVLKGKQGAAELTKDTNTIQVK